MPGTSHTTAPSFRAGRRWLSNHGEDAISYECSVEESPDVSDPAT